MFGDGPIYLRIIPRYYILIVNYYNNYYLMLDITPTN